MTAGSTPIPVGALGVDPRELSPGYAHQLGVPLRGVTTWGCNLRGLISRGLSAAFVLDMALEILHRTWV